MRITTDQNHDVGYLYLKDPILAGEAKRQLFTHDGTIILDLNEKGQLIGIEFLSLKRILPELLESLGV